MAAFSILFLIFWIWMLVAFMKSIMRAIGRLFAWLCTPWGSSDDLMPTLRRPDESVWPGDRRFEALEPRNPVPVIPNVVQDMQQQLDAEKRTAERLERDIADWKHSIGELNAAADNWTDKAATALAAGRNDLARAAIAERQSTQQRIKELEGDVAEMERLLNSHTSDIQGLQAKLSTIYRRNHIAETRLTAAETSARTRQMLYGAQVKDALNRFGDLERAADLAEGHAEALTLGEKPAAVHDPRIDAQLAALQATVNRGFGRKRLAS